MADHALWPAEDSVHNGIGWTDSRSVLQRNDYRRLESSSGLYPAVCYLSDDLVSILQGIRETVRRGRDNGSIILKIARYSSVSLAGTLLFRKERTFYGRNVISR